MNEEGGIKSDEDNSFCFMITQHLLIIIIITFFIVHYKTKAISKVERMAKKNYFTRQKTWVTKKIITQVGAINNIIEFSQHSTSTIKYDKPPGNKKSPVNSYSDSLRPVRKYIQNRQLHIYRTIAQ